MFKCTGICSTCGRCKNSAMMNGANDRKTKILTYPENFKPDKNGQGYGIAIDIGTTTVVGMLWNLTSGEHLGSCAKSNPQNEFGMDVISRITYCMQNDDGLKLLQDKITRCIHGIRESLCNDAGIETTEITKTIVCGNTTMSHLYLGENPKGLAIAPFTPEYTGAVESGDVTVIPNIAGHVGGDITAGIVASRLLESNNLTLFIDIGTNGEIAVTDGKRTLACSTAAGPAFEGASIYQGMRAATGAIEKVRIDENGEVFFKVIGDCEPVGICGSGLIDSVAQMLKVGVINKKGRIISADKTDVAGIKERLIEADGHRMFVLVAKENGEDIVITQNDIREVQLAKGAVAAGIQLMLEDLGKSVADLQNVIVAGAFGNFIDKESAVAIDLLPDVNLARITSAGNTAGAGVSMALLSNKELDAMKFLPARVEHIELAEKENFQNVYMKSMGFK